MIHEIKVKDIDEVTEEEIINLTKRAKVVKAPKKILLEGKQLDYLDKPRGKIVKGGNNEFINRNW